jgi:hypothetical protein
MLHYQPPQDPEPFVMDASINVQRSTRARRPNPKYANIAKAVAWANSCDDKELAEACAIEAHPMMLPSTSDANSWEPAPRTIRDITKLPNGMVKTEWLKSVKSELKTLIDSGTFVFDTMKQGEVSTPIMETFKVKVKSDGTLDKLKTRLVVRGDLQNKTIAEDKWSPTASFRSLKMFLAHAVCLQCRVKQLDFIGAFLQANTRSRIFVTIPAVFGVLFPEYSKYCGIPLRLAMSIYGMTLSGKYWYLDLLEFLLSLNFKPSKNIPCLFMLIGKKGKLFLLNYVDDMLYFGTHTEEVLWFENALKGQFNLEFLGQAHWYLATRINQLANFDIELDQSRYCQSLVKKYLDTVGTKKDTATHTTPLPSGFIPSTEDLSNNETAAKQLAEEYNIDYASCIGSQIYLGMTRTDVLYAVNKWQSSLNAQERNTLKH